VAPSTEPTEQPWEQVGERVHEKKRRFQAVSAAHVSTHLLGGVEPSKRALARGAPYLDKHLTPNVRFWAGFNHTRFSTGAVSTQRGEGLNRHFKAHLSAQSPLSKLFNQVLLKEQREKAKLVLFTAKDEVCPSNYRGRHRDTGRHRQTDNYTDR